MESLSKRLACFDYVVCRHTEKEVADKTCYLSHLQHTDTGLTSPCTDFIPPRWPSDKASASRAEDPGFESRFRRDFFGVESYQ